MAQSNPEPAAVVSWSPHEREDFFAAIARHRRSAWRVTAVCVIASVILGLVASILMAPLFYVALALAFDVANLVSPFPDLFGRAIDTIEAALEQPHAASAAQWIVFACGAALPGAALIAVMLGVVHRLLRLSEYFTRASFGGRSPDPQHLQEQRLQNVIEEMAVAAGLPTPAVRIAPSPEHNAALLGGDEQNATLVVSETLVAQLNRGELQGVAAHLVGALANGDAVIGLQLATVLGTTGLLGRLSGAIHDSEQRSALWRLVKTLRRVGGAAAPRLIVEIADPFASPKASTRKSESLSFRDWLWLPLSGPIAITGFLAGLVGLLILAPLAALAWRRRKLLADATAVRLTRDPNTLASALRTIAGANSGTFAPIVAHLLIAQGASSNEPLGQSWLPMFPTLERRIKALETLGAQPVAATGGEPRSALLLLVYLALAPFMALITLLLATALTLLVVVSIALSALFIAVPAGFIHGALRAISFL